MSEDVDLTILCPSAAPLYRTLYVRNPKVRLGSDRPYSGGSDSF